MLPPLPFLRRVHVQWVVRIACFVYPIQRANDSSIECAVALGPAAITCIPAVATLGTSMCGS